MNSKSKKTLANVLAILLALAFVMAGITKLIGEEMQLANFEKWGYPTWSIYAVGIVEILLGLGIFIKGSRNASRLLIYFWAVGAIGTHIMANELAMISMPVVFVVMAWLIGKLSEAP